MYQRLSNVAYLVRAHEGGAFMGDSKSVLLTKSALPRPRWGLVVRKDYEAAVQHKSLE